MYEITKLATSQFEDTEDTPVIIKQVNYTKRVDFVNDNLLYKGEATVGTIDSHNGWRIKKITLGNDGDVTEQYANGDDNFINIWNDRLTLNYI